ncbi:FtsX-like permease family protein, partial [Candidatus Poribacteria bacterium]|nr:FtsX-like permease family protein [Candidatus Poribacteria bacterium]
MRTLRTTFRYYWRVHLTVALCTAVATGVLAGALIVGDSMRGSLRNITLERLGSIQQALIAEHFFSPEIVDHQNNVPAIILNGSVSAVGSDSRASKVNIYGVQDDFFGFWEEDVIPTLDNQVQSPFPNVAINSSLQKELNVKIGDSILVSLPQSYEIHPEFLLGERDASESIKRLRLVISEIIPTENAGRFNLHASQSLPMNAYIALPELQKALMQPDGVNVLFTSDEHPISHNDLKLTLDELGIYLSEHDDYFDLQSDQFLIKPALSAAALTVASENNIPVLPTLTYLANSIDAERTSDEQSVISKSIPYSTILALPVEEGLFAELLSSNTTEIDQRTYADIKKRLSELKEPIEVHEIYLNDWAADDLGVSVGDRIEVKYFSIDTNDAYITEATHFLLKGIVPIESIAADTDIIPEFPGVSASNDIHDWDPPFPFDNGLIRSKDEVYWDDYKSTPKAFIPLALGKKLWRNRFGDLTTIRMESAPGKDIKATKEIFVAELLKAIRPDQLGFQTISLRSEGLKSSKGSSDFGMLFSSMSGFIIIAVALLVGMVFRLGVEQRSREIGIFQAVGYPVANIRRRFLYEGVMITCVGSILGCLLAIGYAQLMIYGLKTWWLPAIGTPFIQIHISILSLLIGTFISFVVVMFSIYRTVGRLGKISTVSLLAGKTDFGDTAIPPKQRKKRIPGKKSAFALLGIVGIAILVNILPFSSKLAEAFNNFANQPVFAFFLITLTVLLIGWYYFDMWLKYQSFSSQLSRIRFALKNTARQPSRSKTCVLTISLACCIIVAVGANRQDTAPVSDYTYVAESALPLHHNLNSSDGRFELGFSDEDAEILSESVIYPFRVLPGEDVSCLNLYKPEKPQILGAPDTIVAVEKWDNLSVLEQTDTYIPAVGDENSLRWILHHNPKDDFVIQDEAGKDLRLRLDTISNSLFQSQLIISESDFKKAFPSQDGYQFFLIKTPAYLQEQTSQILEKTLEDYGFDVTSASQRLANFRSVQNTYIATFQSLGGLGVLLGTFGLALVLVRNIMERRGELATLRAIGFKRELLSRMLFLESSFLLFIGMFIGVIAGLSGSIFSQDSSPSLPWG